jgi:hypothetical protein
MNFLFHHPWPSSRQELTYESALHLPACVWPRRQQRLRKVASALAEAFGGRRRDLTQTMDKFCFKGSKFSLFAGMLIKNRQICNAPFEMTPGVEMVVGNLKSII